MNKRVLIAGFTGSMGQEAVKLVNSLAGFRLVGGLAPHAEKSLRSMAWMGM